MLLDEPATTACSSSLIEEAAGTTEVFGTCAVTQVQHKRLDGKANIRWLRARHVEVSIAQEECGSK